MNPYLVVPVALTVGIAIGWILATEVNSLLWKRIVEIQRETAAAQKNAINLARNTAAWSEELKAKDERIEEQWKEAVAANEQALKNMREANDMLEESRRKIAEEKQQS